MAKSSQRVEVNFERTRHYLIGRVNCTMKVREHAADYLSEILLESARDRCKKLMIVRKGITPVADGEFADLTQAAYELWPSTFIGFIDHDAPPERFLFAMDRRKTPNLRYFETEDDAAEWLLGVNPYGLPITDPDSLPSPGRPSRRQDA